MVCFGTVGLGPECQISLGTVVWAETKDQVQGSQAKLGMAVKNQVLGYEWLQAEDPALVTRAKPIMG